MVRSHKEDRNEGAEQHVQQNRQGAGSRGGGDGVGSGVGRHDRDDDLLAIDTVVAHAAREVQPRAYLLFACDQLEATPTLEAAPVGVVRAASAVVQLQAALVPDPPRWRLLPPRACAAAGMSTFERCGRAAVPG